MAPGYSDWSVDRFIIEVFFLFLSVDGWCQGVIVTVFFCSFLPDRQQVCLFLHQLVSCHSGSRLKASGGDDDNVD